MPVTNITDPNLADTQPIRTNMPNLCAVCNNETVLPSRPRSRTQESQILTLHCYQANNYARCGTRVAMPQPPSAAPFCWQFHRGQLVTANNYFFSSSGIALPLLIIKVLSSGCADGWGQAANTFCSVVLLMMKFLFCFPSSSSYVNY